MAKQEKKPLQLSVNHNGVDYDAIFERDGDSRKPTGKFVANIAVIGKLRNPIRFHWFEWFFLIVATLSMLGVLAITVYRFYYFETNFINITIMNKSNETVLAHCNTWVCLSDFVFAVALLVNLAFCAFYCYDGVLRERPFEVLAYVIAVIVIIVYTIGNFSYQLSRRADSQHDGDTSDFILKIVRLVLVLIFGPINIILAMVTWWKMGFFIFNIIGADKTLIWAYRSRSFFLTLQWFSLQVTLNIFVLAFARNGQMLSLAEMVILVLVVVLVVLIIVVGNVAVLWEYNVASFIWYVMTVPFVAYCIYKMVNVSINWPVYSEVYTVYNKNVSGTMDEPQTVVSTFKFVGAALIIACLVGIIVAILLWVFMIIAQKYFGRGLKDKIPPPFSQRGKHQILVRQ